MVVVKADQNQDLIQELHGVRDVRVHEPACAHIHYVCDDALKNHESKLKMFNKNMDYNV